MKFTVRLDTEEVRLLKAVEAKALKSRVILYLVGGYLRDIPLRRKKKEPDFDFALASGACAFGRSLSRQIKSAYVVLDEEHGACRLIKRISGKLYTFDFTDFRGPTLEHDLRMRDFTVNALAVTLEDFLKGGNLESKIIDPLKGRADLGKGLLRACSRKAFRQDPLRILRAWSFAALFGWTIGRETKVLMISARNRLRDVSGERIRDELFKIISSPQSYASMCELDRLKILPVIFPEIEQMRGAYQGPYHHLDIWRHTLESLKQFEEIVRQSLRRKNIRQYLRQCISASRSRESLIKLACLLHDVGKPRACRREGRKIKFHGHENIGRAMTVDAGRRLKLSLDEIEALSRMVQAHLRPGYLADRRDTITPRAIYRFFRDTKEEAAGVLLLSLADQRSTRGPLTTDSSRKEHERLIEKLLREYFRKKKEKKVIRLINGDILMDAFHLEPSPLIGRILAELDELQAIGRISSKQDALRAARRMLKQMR